MKLLSVILAIFTIVWTTFNDSIISVITNIFILRCRPIAIKEICFIPSAANVGHPYRTASYGKQVWFHYSLNVHEAHLSTYNLSVFCIESFIAHCTPLTIHVYLHSTIMTIGQTKRNACK